MEVLPRAWHQPHHQETRHFFPASLPCGAAFLLHRFPAGPWHGSRALCPAGSILQVVGKAPRFCLLPLLFLQNSKKGLPVAPHHPLLLLPDRSRLATPAATAAAPASPPSASVVVSACGAVQCTWGSPTSARRPEMWGAREREVETTPALPATYIHTTIADWDILGTWGCAWRCQAGQCLILTCTPFGGPDQRGVHAHAATPALACTPFSGPSQAVWGACSPSPPLARQADHLHDAGLPGSLVNT